jgi:hypothetical protein
MWRDDVVAVLEVPVLLPVATVATVLACSPRTVRRRIADGSLPAVVEHDRLMVRGDELRDYVLRLGRPGTLPPRSRSRQTTAGYDFLRD